MAITTSMNTTIGQICGHSSARPLPLSMMPLTHFLVLVRGIMLKGNGLAELWPQIWPIVVFMLVVIAIGLRFYKRTLD